MRIPKHQRSFTEETAVQFQAVDVYTQPVNFKLFCFGMLRKVLRTTFYLKIMEFLRTSVFQKSPRGSTGDLNQSVPENVEKNIKNENAETPATIYRRNRRPMSRNRRLVYTAWQLQAFLFWNVTECYGKCFAPHYL